MTAEIAKERWHHDAEQAFHSDMCMFIAFRFLCVIRQSPKGGQLAQCRSHRFLGEFKSEVLLQVSFTVLRIEMYMKLLKFENMPVESALSTLVANLRGGR